MNSSLVDVVIPTHDRLEFTLKAIDSVRQQTFADWRLWVVDDGSPDVVYDALVDAAQNDGRVTVIRQDRSGPEAARSRGVAAGSASWVALLDSDDEWLPDKLDRQISAGNSSGANVIICWHSWIRADGSVRTTRRPTDSGGLRPLLTNNMSTPLIRRDILEAAGGVGPLGTLGSLATCEHIEFWLRLSRVATVHVVPEVLAHCRDHDGPRESSRSSSAVGAANLARIIEHHASWLRESPTDLSSLQAQAAARYLAAGNTAAGRLLFARALRHAPARHKLHLLRKYGAFVIKQSFAPLVN
jgi:glycosyltransferase involved in cell wall biosynthesis